MLVAVQECREVAVVMPPGLLGDEGEGVEHGLESLMGALGPVPYLGEVVEVVADLAFVPGEQDDSTSGKYLYSVARPIPESLAIRDIVTEVNPCSATRAAVVSRTAARTAARCASIVSFHSLGTPSGYGRHTDRPGPVTGARATGAVT